MNRDIKKIDDDIARKKRIIGKMLYNDPDIIEILDNNELDPNCPDEYLYNSIYPFIRIPEVQDVSKCFICFNVDDMERVPNNTVMKSQYIQFVIFVHKDLVKTKYGIARHDLLGYLIRDIFNLSNALGPQMELVSNREGTTDVNYCTRTLKFQLTTDNSTKPFRTNPNEYDKIIGHRG